MDILPERKMGEKQIAFISRCIQYSNVNCGIRSVKGSLFVYNSIHMVKPWTYKIFMWKKEGKFEK